MSLVETFVHSHYRPVDGEVKDYPHFIGRERKGQRI